jgi:hypothetical protein
VHPNCLGDLILPSTWNIYLKQDHLTLDLGFFSGKIINLSNHVTHRRAFHKEHELICDQKSDELIRYSVWKN